MLMSIVNDLDKHFDHGDNDYNDGDKLSFCYNLGDRKSIYDQEISYLIIKNNK